MAKDAQLLSSSEFAEKAGIPVSRVTKLIRDGKIKAEKKSGKWMLDPSQIKAAGNTLNSSKAICKEKSSNFKKENSSIHR